MSLVTIIVLVFLGFLTCVKDAPKQRWKIPNRIRCGRSQSGKSLTCLSDTLAICSARCCAVLVADPHGTLAMGLLKHLIAGGMKSRVLFDLLARTDLVLGIEFLKKASSEDWLQRRAEADLFNHEFAEGIARRRGIVNLSIHPWIEEWMLGALNLWQAQKVEVPLFLLPDALRPRTRQFGKFIAGCTDEELKDTFKDMSRWSNAMWRREVAPAWRMLNNVCRAPSFMVRSIPTIGDLGLLFEDQVIIILSGMGLMSESAKRDILAMWIRRASQVVRRRFFETGQPLPLHIVIDEAFSLQGPLVDEFVVNDVKEGQKMGLSFDLITQTIPLGAISHGQSD